MSELSKQRFQKLAGVLKEEKQPIKEADENEETVNLSKEKLEEMLSDIRRAQATVEDAYREFESERDPYGPWSSNPMVDASDALDNVEEYLSKLLEPETW